MASRGGANLLRMRSEFDDKVSGKLDKIRDKFDTLGKSKGAKSILQGVGMGAGIKAWDLVDRGISTAIDTIGGAITSASDLNETLSKSSVIFGDNADEVAAWGKTMATAGGMSQQAALDAASGFAGLFQTVGLAADESADMAQSLTQMGSDLASFFNTDVATALDSLKSGLSGEAEPLKKFNVFLSETAVSAKLAQMGIKKVGGAFTEAQKATARYALIMEQTGAAQGDFARTADGLANSQRTLTAEMENLSAEIGQELLPVALELTRWAKSDGVGALRELFTVVKNLGEGFGFLGYEVGRSLDFMTPWDGVSNEAARGMKTFDRSLVEVGGALYKIPAATGPAAAGFDDVKDEAGDAAKKLDDFKDAINDAVDAVIVASFEPEQLALKLTATKRELKDNQTELNKLLAKGKKTPGDWDRIVELRSEVSEGKEETISLTSRLAGLDGLTLDEITATMKALGARSKWAGDQVLRLNRLLGNTNTNYSPRTGGHQPLASGGPALPGRTYTVGEEGTETLVMGQSGGYVIPHGRRGGSSSGGGAPVTIQLQLDGRVVAEVVDRQLYYKAARAPQSRYAG